MTRKRFTYTCDTTPVLVFQDQLLITISRIVILGVKAIGVCVICLIGAQDLAQDSEWVVDTLKWGIGQTLTLSLPPGCTKNREYIIDYGLIDYKWKTGALNLSEGLVSIDAQPPKNAQWKSLEPHCITNDGETPKFRWAQNDTLYMVQCSAYEPFNLLGMTMVNGKDTLYRVFESMDATPFDSSGALQSITHQPLWYNDKRINLTLDGEKTGLWLTKTNEYLKVENYHNGDLVTVTMYSLWKNQIHHQASLMVLRDNIPQSIYFWNTQGIPTLIVTGIEIDPKSKGLIGHAQKFSGNMSTMEEFDIKIIDSALDSFQYSPK